MPEYKKWMSMRGRCKRPTQVSFDSYGGRGIRVCERWDSFANFYADMGPRPSPQHSLDRIDVNGNYEPSNCRWATRREQSLNTRRNVRITARGKTLTVKEWSEELGVKYHTLLQRVRRKWSDEDIINTPLRMQ